MTNNSIHFDNIDEIMNAFINGLMAYHHEEYRQLMQTRSLFESPEEKELYDRLESKHLMLRDRCLKLNLQIKKPCDSILH